MSRTTAIVENGSEIYASSGAVRQHDGKLKIYQCNECHGQVVWVTSKKTGKFYLVNVRHGAESGARFYMGHDIHKCSEVKDYGDKIVAMIEGTTP